MVVGPSGSGKSLLLQLLAAGFREQFQVAYLNSAKFARVRHSSKAFCLS